MIRPKKLILIFVVSVITKVEMSKDMMKTLTINFSKPLEDCKKEMELSESAMKDFANFWKEGFVLTDRTVGCAIVCIASRLDLYDPDYNLHHANAHEFIKKHGADDAMSKQLIDIIHGCMEAIPAEPDFCVRTVKVVMCFKNKIHDLDWAPDPDLIMAEMLSETS